MKKYIKPEIEISKFQIDTEIALGALFSLSATSGAPNVDGGSVDFISGWLGI